MSLSELVTLLNPPDVELSGLYLKLNAVSKTSFNILVFSLEDSRSNNLSIALIPSCNFSFGNDINPLLTILSCFLQMPLKKLGIHHMLLLLPKVF